MRRGAAEVAEKDTEKQRVFSLFSAFLSALSVSLRLHFFPQIIRKLPVIMTLRYRVNVSGVVMPSPVGVAML